MDLWRLLKVSGKIIIIKISITRFLQIWIESNYGLNLCALISNLYKINLIMKELLDN